MGNKNNGDILTKIINEYKAVTSEMAQGKFSLKIFKT